MSSILLQILLNHHPLLLLLHLHLLFQSEEIISSSVTSLHLPLPPVSQLVLLMLWLPPGRKQDQWRRASRGLEQRSGVQ
ncbi:hypothetical protein QJS04_geneDACA006433 [Acorus gramineus]|uniref:Uncharacterized protein n=1 Tax=Acorus gramineus TaxID=55184 RepID=A0AAV9AXV9_ACOGR|nr:hypothetical protein QJS04_geneDACA006433 [Acorus gramineus]